MQRPVHLSFERIKTVVDGSKYGWTGNTKMKEQKRSYKTIDIVSYPLKVSINGVTCVFVVHFRSLDTFKVCKLASQLTSTCPPKHVTGNISVLHKALMSVVVTDSVQ